MSKRRVVVTGFGMVTPVGNNTKESWANILNGVSGVGQVEGFDTSEYSTKIWAKVKDFNPEEHFEIKDVKKMDLFIQYGVVAANEAIAHANLSINEKNAHRCGVAVGAGIGGIRTITHSQEKLLAGGPKKVSPYFIPAAIINMVAGQISIKHGMKGPNLSIVTACTTGTHNIGLAARLIQYGDADVMVAGGAESAITPLGVAGFASAKALSFRNDDPSTASRPFDAERNGFVIGEGAGVIVLESLEHAQARGAQILAEVVGYGMTCDAHHITSPTPGGVGGAEAMRLALKDARLEPEAVDYVNAHGTSTQANDSNETSAIKSALGDWAYQIPVSSTKSMTGHLLGGSGGIEAVAAVLAIEHNLVPPTINYQNPDPACDLDVVPNQAREHTLNVVLSNSFGFGGHNVCLAFRRMA